MSLKEIWPSLTFMFAAVNLAAWFFHGVPLFNMWWLAVLIIADFLLGMAALLAIIAAREAVNK